MLIKERAVHILAELKGHTPFTCVGALLGIVFMLMFRNIGASGSRMLFSFFHPAHVALSALVTASMFNIHARKKRFLTVLLVGYVGSIGIATLSDIVIPHTGAKLLGLDIPTHAQMHTREAPPVRNDRETHAEQAPEAAGAAMHLGFIEEWYFVQTAAVLGVLLAYLLQHTMVPHAAHVLVSTWASSSYLLMTVQSEMTISTALGVLVVLFVATWLPCWISDIVFPLLFVKPDVELEAACDDHRRHSHPHVHK